MEPPKSQLIQRATSVAEIPRAFRPNPLSAGEMEFYSDSLNSCRANHLQRRIQDDLIESVEFGFFFKGVLYGNRGSGKSTEVNRLLDVDEIKKRFIVVRLDALDELNPQTFSVVEVLSLLIANVIIKCREVCGSRGQAFHESWLMENDLRDQLKPFFPDLQSGISEAKKTEGSGEINIAQTLKLAVRFGRDRKEDFAKHSGSLSGLKEVLTKLVQAVKSKLPDCELLVVGENFDKEQIPPQLLIDTFVKYSALLKDLPLHLFFTLPVPFVYSYGDQLAFPREKRYPIYDVPVFNETHGEHRPGIKALTELVEMRADVKAIFGPGALDLLLKASGGDLYLLFAMTNKASRIAKYRAEDDSESKVQILRKDAVVVVREQLSIFRNEMGSAPNTKDSTWEDKRKKLRQIYENDADGRVPDEVLYDLLRRRAVLFCNGKGRYAVHPLAVEMLRENFPNEPDFYKGGGLDLDK